MNKYRLISELPDGIKQLAELRRDEYQDYLTQNNIKLPPNYDGDTLISAFSFSSTPEKYEFWRLVNDGRFEEVMTLKTVEG